MIEAIPALSDNYIWLLEENDALVVVDPGEAAPVIDALKTKNKPVNTILITHNHHDHVDGVTQLKAAYPNVEVIGPEEARDYVDTIVQPNERLQVGERIYEVILAAGHTEGHIVYWSDNILFCGDALFAGGCGRVFTKNYAEAFEGMQRLRRLPDEVHVYAGHEYTQTNLTFALTIQPENPAITQALERAEHLQSQGVPTLPTTIGMEKTYNVFLTAESEAVFKTYRDKRDQF